MKHRFFLPFLALLAVAGCAHRTQPAIVHGENYPPEGQPRAVYEVNAAQSAAGARADATLYAAHFNQAGLNSLGQQKLDLMLGADEPAQPLVVYFDLPSGASLDSAHNSVRNYLKTQGLGDSQIKLLDGPNPQMLHPAADAMAGLENLRQQQTGGGVAAPIGTRQQPSSGGTGTGSTSPDSKGY